MDIISLLGQIATNGVMSVLFAASCFVCYRLFTLYLQTQAMLLEEKDKHRENVEKVTNEYTTVTKAYQNSIDILTARLDSNKK